MVGVLQLQLAALLVMASCTHGEMEVQPDAATEPEGGQVLASESVAHKEHKIWHHLEKLRKAIHKEANKEHELGPRIEKLEDQKMEHEREEEELVDKLEQQFQQDADDVKQQLQRDAERHNGSMAPQISNRTQEPEQHTSQQLNGSAAGQRPNISVTPHPSLNRTRGPVQGGSQPRNGSAASPQPKTDAAPHRQRPNETQQPAQPGNTAAPRSANGSAAPRPQSPNRTGERAGPQGPQRNGTARPPPRGHLRNGSATSRNRSRHQAGTQLPEQGVTPPARIAREAKRHTAALALAALVGGCCLSVSFWVALSVCVAAVRASPECAVGMRAPLLAA